MQTEEIILPPLREDLKLLKDRPSEDGSKQWMLFDPIQNRYFTIGIDTFELIYHWEAGLTEKQFIAKLLDNSYEIDEEALEPFLLFIHNNGLVKISTEKDIKYLYNLKKGMKQNTLKWLLHNYLFIKIPIFRPDKWLASNLRHVTFFYSNLWRNIVILMGSIGILMVIRDWNSFTNTFMYFFSSEGMVFYFFSLVFIKSAHELGHAFTAKRFGAKVPSMGLAFLVLFPVLYTDTTNAYALQSKYQRLKIALAGIKVEIYLAMIATFLWSFLPEGTAKSIAFTIATTSWITSLLVNISPFLRFDGYYILSDITNTKNLQPRSFAMARWFIRYYIVGIDEVEPETMNKTRKRFFVTYAVLTWMYRFILFLGIALLVYHFAFKVLGIILFLVEIIWFILLPIYKEMRVWFEKKDTISLNFRNGVSFTILIFLMILTFAPWQKIVRVPAVLTYKSIIEIYSPKDAKISKIFVSNGSHVNKNDILMVLVSDSIEDKLTKLNHELNILNLSYKKYVVDNEIKTQKLILKESILKKELEIRSVKDEKKSLVIRAPFKGIINFNDTFNVKQIVNHKESIFTLYDPKSIKVLGYCSDITYEYVKESTTGKFISDLPNLKSLDIAIESLSPISSLNIEFEELSSTYEGSIATRPLKEGKQNNSLVSEEALFKIVGTPLNLGYNIQNRISGTLVVDSNYVSYIYIWIRKAYTVLQKESGF